MTSVKVRDEDAAYLAKHALLSGAMEALLKARPPDVLAFLIDTLSGVEGAAQDAELQLAEWRLDKLAAVFARMDRVRAGQGLCAHGSSPSLSCSLDSAEHSVLTRARGAPQ